MRVKDQCEKFGLRFNIKKRKIITIAENTWVRVQFDNETIKTVKEFNFLGSKIDQSGDSALKSEGV